MAFHRILRRYGEGVVWRKRMEGAIDTETGDRIVTWSTETIKAVVQRVSAGEILVEAGYTSEDYIRVFVTADIQPKDKVAYRNVEYEVLVPEAFYLRGALEYRTALCRRLTV